MTESTLGAFIRSVEPVRDVRAADLHRVWLFLASQPPETAIKLDLLADLCDRDADVLALWFRASLVQALFQQGRLDRWRTGDLLQEHVFEVAASIPFPNGPARADPDAVIAALEESRPSSS